MASNNFFKQLFGIAAPVVGGMFGGPVGAAAGSAIGGGVSGGSNPFASVGKSLMGGLGNIFGGSNAYAATASPKIQNTSVPGMKTSFFNPQQLAYQNQMNTPAKQQSSQGGLLSSIFGGKNNTLLAGLGTMLGSQFLKSPKVPQGNQLPQSVIDFQNQARSGSQIGNLGQQRLTEQLNQQLPQVQQAEIDAALRQLQQSQEDEMRQLTGTYKSLRPGTDVTTDSSYARDVSLLNDRYARSKADIAAQLNRQVYNDFQTQRAQQIAASQGMDINRLNQLAQAGQIDIDQLMNQTALDYNDKKYLRDYLLGFGGNLAYGQMGMNPFSSSEGE